MRWEDERYVRLYTRDTANWKRLPWQSKCLLPLILRKLDRAGIADVGGDIQDGLAALLDIPLDLVTTGLPPLLSQGVFVVKDDCLVMPNFLAAQEVRQSDKARKAAQRERARAKILNDSNSEESRPVTGSHTESPEVTPCLAVPSLTEGGDARAHDPCAQGVVPVPEPAPPPPPQEPPAKAKEPERKPTVVHCPTVESAVEFDAELALSELSRASGFLIQGFCGAQQLEQLKIQAQRAKPRPLTVQDFRDFGEAYAAKKALAWLNKPPTVGQLLQNEAKWLFDGLAETAAWKASRQKPAGPVRIVAPKSHDVPLTDSQRREAAHVAREQLAALRAKAVGDGHAG